MEDNYILFFDQIDKNALSLVGGKGANLGEMTKAGFPVLSGFCITTEAYKEFLKSNNLTTSINETIKEANPDNINQTGKKIRNKIKEAKVPEIIIKTIKKALEKIDIDNYFAVRSSATAEDLSFASFAGQQETYLNIKGEQSILESVKECWASLYTDRAILYRIKNKIEQQKVFMSVIVQEMVHPDISGVMFTADPVSGHRGIISIL